MRRERGVADKTGQPRDGLLVVGVKRAENAVAVELHGADGGENGAVGAALLDARRKRDDRSVKRMDA